MPRRAFTPDALGRLELEDRVVPSRVASLAQGSVPLSGLRYIMAIDMVRAGVMARIAADHEALTSNALAPAAALGAAGA